jgi:hypothetical protein
MPPREDDVAPRRTVARSRTPVLAGGFALAVLATLAVFLTDNPQYLRVAVVVVAWAFVLAMVATGRRADRVTAAAREAELRQVYEAELDREYAARRAYEADLEHELRREAEDAMRYELDALRGDIAALAGLRDEVARVSELRGDLAALSGLRDEVARVAALRDDVAALMALRQDLGQLAELRADMGRLRAELTEQLSSEMLVERIVMRTQASRLPADSGSGRPIDSGASWTDDAPPRELTGGWPAVRLDEPRETQQFEQVRVERQSASWEPVTSELRSWDTPPTAAFPEPQPVYAPPPPPAYSPPPLSSFSPPVPPTSAFPMSPPPRSAPPVAPPPTGLNPIAPPPVPEPLPTPMEWLAARSLVDPSPAAAPPEIPPRRRRTDDEDEPPDLAAAPTMQRPAVPADPSPGPRNEKRLDEILAENGVSPAPGGRRRRRYRDEDEPDDVLARVLGRN